MMNRFTTKLFLAVTSLALLIISHSSFAQQADSASIGTGYTNQTFYSMANGTVSSVLHTDWDLAFQITGYEATILVNSKNNVHLYKTGKDIAQWAGVVANDTVGYLNGGYELLNSDTSWWAGAFNGTNDINDPFDLGWGNYDFATHYVNGDSLYYIQLASGVVKKLWIVDLANSVYDFKYADLDGSNEITVAVNKTNYTNKNFGYYSIENGTALDREPLKTDWDIVFNQYLAIFPLTYKVTGVLQNFGVSAIKTYPVEISNATTNGQNFDSTINIIGYDWKAYDFNTNSYVIEDSTVYFLKDLPGNYWKINFTGFGGSANGTFYFNKQQIIPTGINEINKGAISLMEVNPNPTSENIHLIYDLKAGAMKASVSLQNNLGQMVFSKTLNPVAGLNELFVPCNTLSKGIYFLSLTTNGIKEVRKISVQ